jgi:hypothetical protein
VFIIIFINRRSPLIKAATVEFCFLMLFFDGILVVGSILYAEEATDAICQARPWFTAVPLVGYTRFNILSLTDFFD